MSSKDFSKGMEAGAKPFEEKFKKQADAINRVSDKIEEGIKGVSGVVNEVIEELTSIEKKQLYDLNTQYDIKKMEDYEKELLLAGLFTLARETANENQQAFIRSVKKYLGIANPQTEVDLTGIENIENLSTQKAMFQVFSEFLFLKNEDNSFYNDYADLFDCFSIKKKDRAVLFENVIRIYKATGTQGICEKYGYVPDTGKNIFEEEAIKLTKLLIKKDIDISDSEEKKFYGQELILSANINCSGSLILDHCVLVYNGDNITGKILLDDSASFTMTNCTVVGKNNKTSIEYSYEYLIDGTGEEVIIENSLFYNCKFFANFFYETAVTIENCIVQFSKLPPATKFIKCTGESKKMINCLFENLDSKRIKSKEKYQFSSSNEYIIEGIQNISMCTFKNIPGCVSYPSSENKLLVSNCVFNGCIGLINASGAKIINCIFDESEQIMDFMLGGVEIKHCQFFECKNRLVKTMDNIEISNCDVYNYVNKDGGGGVFPEGAMHFMYMDSFHGNISKCNFDGLNFTDNSWFITCLVNKASQTHAVSVEDCVFSHCVTKSKSMEIIKCTSTVFGMFGSAKDIDVVNIDHCKGLGAINKKGEGDKAENIKKVYETSTGEPIGINANDLIAGVAGYDYMQETKNKTAEKVEKDVVIQEWTEITDNLSDAEGVWETADEHIMELGSELSESGIALQSMCIKIDDEGEMSCYFLCDCKSFVKESAKENNCSINEAWAEVVEDTEIIVIDKYKIIMPMGNAFDNIDFSPVSLHQSREKLKLVNSYDRSEFLFKKSKLEIKRD
jgi:hypothetical protein